MSAVEQRLGGLVAVPLEQVHPSPANPRVRLNEIDDLALSIRENGLLQPLVVQRIPGRPGVQIVAGHRRYAAAVKLGWTKVPCIVRRDMLPDEELLAMLVENGQRANLDPIEEARAYKKLKGVGLTDADVARKVGRSINTVRNRLDLLRLSAKEQEQVRAGQYTISHATGLIRADRAREREAANPVARPVGRPKGAKTKPYFGDTHPLAGAARARCGTNGHGKGHIKVAGVACGPCWEATIRDDQAAAS